MFLFLGYLIFREYLIPSRCRTFLWKLLNIFLFTCSIVGVISIIISRGHYLIDILLAYYITTRLFWTYHTLCYTNVLRVSQNDSRFLVKKLFECSIQSQEEKFQKEL